MNNFVYKNNQFIYDGADGEKLLLDCNHFLQNKSRVPFHSLDDHTLTVPKMIFDLLDKHSKLCEGTELQNCGSYYSLIDVLVTAYHVKSSAQKKILELGCLNGVMSYHLATILGKLHPQSLLYSVSNTIGNDSSNLWLDFVSKIEELPQLAFAAADYEATNLKDENFDIIIINGDTPIDHPDFVLLEAQRLIRQEGLIICFAMNQPLLESSFQLLFPEREEYFFHYDRKILTAKKL